MSSLPAAPAAHRLAAPVKPDSPALRHLIDALAEGALARDRGEASTHDAIALMRAAGLGKFRLAGPQGGGASLRQLFELVLELGAADSNIPHILRNHFGFTEKLLRSPAHPVYRKWLAEVADGRLFGTGGSEANIQDIGSGKVDSTLTPDGDDGYRLDGVKAYGTGNLYVDAIFVLARTTEGRPAHALVPVDRAGVHIDDDWDGIGQRHTASGTTRLVNVRVEAADVIFRENGGTAIPHDATFYQLYLTTIIAGILRAVLRDAVALVKSRDRNYYHALSPVPADDPLLHQTIGRIASQAYVAEASVLYAVDALEKAFASATAGAPDKDLFVTAALRAAKSKVVVDELAQQAAAALFDVGGASSARQSKQLDRHWRNLRTIASHNPVSYKARVIGLYEVSGTGLPTGAFF